jgi:hypothetical protein
MNTYDEEYDEERTCHHQSTPLITIIAGIPGLAVHCESNGL